MELKSAVIGDAQRDPEGGKTPPRTGFAPDALPEVQPSTPAENSQTGVSASYVQPTNEPLHWYVLRATYGRVKASYDYLAAQGITVYHPTIFVYLICYQQDADTIIVPNDKHQFEKGETVIVTGGDFMDVIYPPVRCFLHHYPYRSLGA